jgi:hypothetical protein
MSEREPEQTRSVETTGLAWGVRSSFRRYVQRVALGSEIPDGRAGMLPDGRLYFPVRNVMRFDGIALDAEIAFAGGIRFRGHAGMIDLRLGELELQLNGGRGTLRTSSGIGVRDLADVEVSDASVYEASAVLVLTSRLADGAQDLFDDVYPAATPFDDLEIRIARPPD